MAQMYPSRIPSYVRKNPLRAAECKTYDAFESQLDDSFHVFYSSPWIGTSRTGEEIDGEADFTIAHAQLGMLVIEVKGGRIDIEQGSRKWTSTDRNGITFNIKDPVNQAMKGKHHLLTQMKERPEWSSKFINARHGVILPDVKDPPRDLGASMPLRIFAFASDMHSLSDWVRNRFGDFDDPSEATRVKPLGQDGIRALKALVSDGITFNIDLRTYLDDDINTIERLTEQQYWILEAMAANLRMAIPGAAGTGKTLLAAQQAVAMCKQGKKVLLVCYNAPLAAFLKSRLGDSPNLTVESFHQLAKSSAQQAGISIPAALENNQTTIDRIFIDALSSIPGLRFDAIIVDEGQDFTSEWLESLEFALIDSETSTYHVFYDSNQDVQNKSGNYIQNMGAFNYPLTRNFRNTKNIFGLSKRFYMGPNITAIGPPGVPVEWVPVRFGTRSKAALKIWLGNLLKEERISPDRIAILCEKLDTVNALAPDQKLGKFEVTSATFREEGKIVLDSIRRFKGLESDIVVIYQPQKYLDDIELLYVATSRARAKLAVVGSDDALEFLKQR